MASVRGAIENAKAIINDKRTKNYIDIIGEQVVLNDDEVVEGGIHLTDSSDRISFKKKYFPNTNDALLVDAIKVFKKIFGGRFPLTLTEHDPPCSEEEYDILKDGLINRFQTLSNDIYTLNVQKRDSEQIRTKMAHLQKMRNFLYDIQYKRDNALCTVYDEDGSGDFTYSSYDDKLRKNLLKFILYSLFSFALESTNDNALNQSFLSKIGVEISTNELDKKYLELFGENTKIDESDIPEFLNKWKSLQAHNNKLPGLVVQLLELTGNKKYNDRINQENLTLSNLKDSINTMLLGTSTETLPTGTPSTGTRTTGTPLTGTRPTGTPLTGTRPTGTPSTGTRPTGTPLTGTRPTGTPPTGTPPRGTRPRGTPPRGTPSTGTLSGGAILPGPLPNLPEELKINISNMVSNTTDMDDLIQNILEAVDTSYSKLNKKNESNRGELSNVIDFNKKCEEDSKINEEELKRTSLELQTHTNTNKELSAKNKELLGIKEKLEQINVDQREKLEELQTKFKGVIDMLTANNKGLVNSINNEIHSKVDSISKDSSEDVNNRLSELLQHILNSLETNIGKVNDVVASLNSPDPVPFLPATGGGIRKKIDIQQTIKHCKEKLNPLSTLLANIEKSVQNGALDAKKAKLKALNELLKESPNKASIKRQIKTVKSEISKIKNADTSIESLLTSMCEY